MLDPLDETIDHLFLAGLFERDGVTAVPSLRCMGASGKFDERDHSVLCVFQKFGVAA